MKVTFVLPPVNLSGGIRSTAALAEALIHRGHDVLAVCPPNRHPSFGRRIKFLLKGQGEIFVPSSGPSHFDDVDVPLKVVNHPAPITDADLPDADIVVATWWETAEWVAKFSKSKGAKVYFIRHHEVHDYLPKERVKATYALPMHKITISEWLVNLMRMQYGDDNVSLVPNSIDPHKYYASSRGKQLVPTVGLMYSTTYWKGCDVSLKAFSLAAQKIPNLRLVAFGLKAPSPKLPLPEGTKYTLQPAQEIIKDFYSKCDVWLFGSRTEGFGRPILEAMACRTPVIGTPAGAAPELLALGGGILVQPEDPEDMAKAIMRVCQLSTQEWQIMSTNAYKTAMNYTWDNAAKLCEEAFAWAIKRTQKGEI